MVKETSCMTVVRLHDIVWLLKNSEWLLKDSEMAYGEGCMTVARLLKDSEMVYGEKVARQL